MAYSPGFSKAAMQNLEQAVTETREHLGWAPRWHVRDGLERTVKYFANELARSGGVIIPTGPGAAKPKPKEDE